MNHLLQQILKNKEQEVNKLKELLNSKYNSASINQIKNSKTNSQRKSLKKALKGDSTGQSFSNRISKAISIIAEVKRKSPSKGVLSEIADPTLLVNEYLQGGANAISILTDQVFFSGSINDLKMVSNALKQTNTPVLRKDFIIDRSQIIESALIGADAVLLIVAALQQKTAELINSAKEFGLDALVEVHNEQELEIAIESGAEIIGVNNRNLDTFNVDLNLSIELCHRIPDPIVKISESGIHNLEDIRKIKAAGFDAALIGEALVQSNNPALLIEEMRAIR